MSRLSMRLLALLVSAFAITHVCFAQDLPDVAQGLQPYATYHGGDLDQVSILNGGLTVRIPLMSYPQKGALSLSYSVIFNSFGFQDVAQCITSEGYNGPVATDPEHNGCTYTLEQIPTALPGSFPMSPRLVADQTLMAVGLAVKEPLQTAQPPLDGRFYVVSSDNAEHPLAPTVNGYRSIDESGYLFTPANAPAVGTNMSGPLPPDTVGTQTPYRADGTIVDSHGIVYTYNSVSDPDGNTISIPNYPSGLFSGLPATDSANRTIPAPVQLSDISQCPTLQNAQRQPLASAYSWTPPGPNGTVTYIFCYASVNIQTHDPLAGNGQKSGSSQYSRTVQMLQSIVLPNANGTPTKGTYWGFIYDSNDPSQNQNPSVANLSTGQGQLLSLIFPTGGSLNYTYQANEGACDGVRPGGGNPGGTAILTYPNQVMTRTMQDAQGNVLGQWQYTPATGPGSGSILGPDGNLTVYNFTGDPNQDNDAPPCTAFDSGHTVYQGSSTSGKVLQSVVKQYQSPALPGLPYAAAVRLQSTTTTLDDGSSSSVQLSYGTQLNFSSIVCDQNGQNCGAGNGSSGTPNYIGGPTSVTYTGFDGSILKQESTPRWWNSHPSYLAANLIELPASDTVTGGGITASTTYTYDESSYSSGNLAGHVTTTAKSLDRATGPAPTTHVGWYASGKKAYTIDANGNHNSNGHTTDYQYNLCNGSLLTDTTNALNQHVSGGYDCNSGLLTSYTDANLNTTQVNWDTMGRLHQVTYPAIQTSSGQSGTPQTTFDYDDLDNTVTRTISATPDPNEVTQVLFDGFGREIHRYTTDVASPITIDTNYDSSGRVYSVSNPYRSASDPTGLTITNYDALNRKVSEQQPDNINSVSWQYTGPTADSWDEAGVHHQATTDALGRLTKMLELGTSSNATNYETDYFYDGMGNLLCAEQHGGISGTGCASSPSADASSPWRVRRFVYDSLSRLVTSKNPETGTTCYGVWNGGNCVNGYDANGNPIAKTDANGMTLYYGYDGLNRLLTKSAADIDAPQGGMSVSTLGYDQGTNGVGRLTSQSRDGVAGEGYSYDAMGHVSGTSWCQYIPGSGCQGRQGLQVLYDLAGNPGQITYPDGRVVTQAWNIAGRLGSIQDQGTGEIYFGGSSDSTSSLAQYYPSGTLASSAFGNGVTQTFTLNTRLQVCHAIASTPALGATSGHANLLDRSSYFSPSANQNCGNETGNNGNIYAIGDAVNQGFSQGFRYDSLNRLTSAAAVDGAFNHTYNNDPFGNMTPQYPEAPSLIFQVDPATNRMYVNGGYFGYDSDGYITFIANPNGYGGHSLAYTAEGYLRCIDGCGQGSLGSYLVDGIGQRSYESRPWGATWPVYLNGQVMTEYTDSGTITDYIYANGQKIARVEPAGGEAPLHLSGVNCANCGGSSTYVQLSSGAGRVIQSGDVLNVSQYTVGTSEGGVILFFSDGSRAGGGNAYDSDGQQDNCDGVKDQWHQRHVDLSAFAGKTLSSTLLINDVCSGPGQFDIYFDNVAINGNGTTSTIYANQPGAAFTPTDSSYWPGQATNTSAVAQANPNAPELNTQYYLADHLGTTQMEIAEGGWPTWQGRFTPFGFEVGNTTFFMGTQPSESTCSAHQHTAIRGGTG